MCVVVLNIVSSNPLGLKIDIITYDYIVKGSNDKSYSVNEDIPLNVATHGLITFIEEVSTSQIEMQYVCIMYSSTMHILKVLLIRFYISHLVDLF